MNSKSTSFIENKIPIVEHKVPEWNDVSVKYITNLLGDVKSTESGSGKHLSFINSSTVRNYYFFSYNIIFLGQESQIHLKLIK